MNKEDVRDEAPPPASTERLRMAVLGIGGALMAFGVFGGLSGLGRSGSGEPLDAVPKASFIAATVDFAELRRSPIYDALLGKESLGVEPVRRALGVGELTEGCGFDPLTRVQGFAVSIPEEGERGTFGVAARVEVTRDELERCARSLADKRGGHAETRDVGTFVVLEDGSSVSPTRPRLAYGKSGLLVVSQGAWFDAMLGAADHRKPSLRDAQEHMALRSSLTSREGFRKPTLLATAILPRSLRERLKGEMGVEAESRGARGAEPLEREAGGEDTSNAIMAGVLGVGSVGVAIHAGGAGQNIDVAVELVCDTAPACEAVERLAQKKRAEWSRDLALRMVGLGPLLDSIKVEKEGLRLRATSSANVDALTSALGRMMKLRAPRGGPGPVRPPKPAPPTDDVVPSRPDAAAPSGRPSPSP